MRERDQAEGEISQETPGRKPGKKERQPGQETETEEIGKEKKKQGKKRPGRKGGISSHEETIHGTKIQDFD